MTETTNPGDVEAVERRIDQALEALAALHPDQAVAVPRAAFEQLIGVLHRQQTANLLMMNLVLAVALGKKELLGDLSEKLRSDLFACEDQVARFLEAVASFNVRPGSPVN